MAARNASARKLIFRSVSPPPSQNVSGVSAVILSETMTGTFPSRRGRLGERRASSFGSKIHFNLNLFSLKFFSNFFFQLFPDTAHRV